MSPGSAPRCSPKWPGAIHEGGGRATCYIDARGNDSQRAALTRVVRGELGGPWGLFIKTYDAWRRRLPRGSTFTWRNMRSRATIGDAVKLELQKIRNPVTHAEVHPEVVLPEGLVVKRGGMAASSVFRVNDELAVRSLGPVRRVRPIRVFLR